MQETNCHANSQTIHEGQANYKCKDCGKKYTHHEGLRQHVNIIHKGERYQCEKCPKIFTQRSSLIKHIKIKHDDESEKFAHKCDSCEKSYQYRSALNLHRKVVHDGKRIECQLCDKIYTDLGSLKKHMRKFHPIEFSQNKHRKVKYTAPMS